MPAPRPIFLLTDFGVESYYPGVMRAVISSRAPAATVVDLCHGIAPGDVREAGFVLEASLPWLPTGAVVLAVIDPGVGTERDILVATGAGWTVVAPDNGLLTGVIGGGGELRRVDQARVALPEPSRTFHGRDVFAPLAAELATRAGPGSVGDLAGELAAAPVTLPGWDPEVQPEGALGRVVHVDSFGNLVTNIHGSQLPSRARDAVVEAGGHRLLGIVPTYGAVGPGDVLAYVGSAGYLEIAVRDGRADVTVGLGRGAPVRAGLTRS